MEFSTILSEEENVLGLLYCHQSLKCNTTNINCANSISAILRCWITVFRGRNTDFQKHQHTNTWVLSVCLTATYYSLCSQWNPQNITEELCWIMAKTPNLQQLNNKLSSLASNCSANLNNWHWKSCFITRLPPSMFVLWPTVGLSCFQCGSEDLMVFALWALVVLCVTLETDGVRELWVHTLPTSPAQTHTGHSTGERCTMAAPAQSAPVLINSQGSWFSDTNWEASVDTHTQPLREALSNPASSTKQQIQRHPWA